MVNISLTVEEYKELEIIIKTHSKNKKISKYLQNIKDNLYIDSSCILTYGSYPFEKKYIDNQNSVITKIKEKINSYYEIHGF